MMLKECPTIELALFRLSRETFFIVLYESMPMNLLLLSFYDCTASQ